MTDNSTPYSHVRQSRRHLLELPDNERILVCLEDIFIEYQNAQSILDSVNFMLQMRNKIQAPCMLVWGSGGYGKTSIINRLKYLNSHQTKKLIFMSFRQNPNNYNFRELLFEAFGMPITRKYSGYDSSKEFARSVERNNIRGIVIDEIHDALTLTPVQQKINLSLLKNLSGEQYNLSVFAFGTDKASEALRLDPQLERRYLQWPLARWTLDEHFRSFLMAYERTLPLKYESMLWSEKLARLIHKASGGIMDNVAKIIQVCAAESILTEIDKITPEIVGRTPFLAAKFGVSLIMPTGNPSGN